MSDILTDILFAVTGSTIGNTFTIEIPVSGSIGSPLLIEPQTIYYEIKLSGKEHITIY
jgi:hypothetical protein